MSAFSNIPPQAVLPLGAYDKSELERAALRAEDRDVPLRLILDPRAPQSLPAAMAARPSAGGEPAPSRVVLLCGPESGFSEAELRQAAEAGWLSVALGPRVLRTETAGLAALAVLQAGWGDLR